MTWDASADYDTLTFRPELATLRPDEVVCKHCNITFFYRLPGCPDAFCPGHWPL